MLSGKKLFLKATPYSEYKKVWSYGNFCEELA